MTPKPEALRLAVAVAKECLERAQATGDARLIAAAARRHAQAVEAYYAAGGRPQTRTGR